MLLQPKNQLPAVNEVVSSSAPTTSATVLSSAEDFKKYWVSNPDNMKIAAEKCAELRASATLSDEKLVDGKFKVYEDKEGNKFIISYTTRVNLDEEGNIPSNMYSTLRMEETGEKLYVVDSEITKECRPLFENRR